MAIREYVEFILAAERQADLSTALTMLCDHSNAWPVQQDVGHDDHQDEDVAIRLSELAKLPDHTGINNDIDIPNPGMKLMSRIRK